MRLVRHYLRTRITRSAAFWIVGLGAFAWTMLRVTEDSCLALLVKTIIPMSAAVLIGMGAHSPFGEVELASGSPLTRLRFGHLGGLLAWGAAAMLLAGAAEPNASAAAAGEMMVRNLIGFTGLALLAGVFVGSGSGWIVPFGYGLTTFLAAMPDERAGWWAWPVRPIGNTGALVCALGFGVVGLVVASRTGTRDRQLATG